MNAFLYIYIYICNLFSFLQDTVHIAGERLLIIEMANQFADQDISIFCPLSCVTSELVIVFFPIDAVGQSRKVLISS